MNPKSISRVCLAIMFFCALLHADDSQVQATFQGKVFFLRGFPRGKHFDYDSQGHPLKSAEAGPWTLSGFKPTEVQITPMMLVLKGKRVGVLFLKGSQRKMRDLKSEITIEIHTVPTNKTEAEQLRDAIFFKDESELNASAPPAWQPFLTGKNASEYARTPEHP